MLCARPSITASGLATRFMIYRQGILKLQAFVLLLFLTFYFFLSCFLVGMIKVRHCGRTAGEISFQISLSVRWFDESLAGIEWQWRDFGVLIVPWQTNGLECGWALFLGAKENCWRIFQTSVSGKGEAGLCMWHQRQIVTSYYKTLHACIHPVDDRTHVFLTLCHYVVLLKHFESY